MSDNPPNPPSGALKIGDLKKLIQDTIAEVLKPEDKSDDKPDEKVESGSIAQRVTAELEKIRKREADETEKATIKSELEAVKSKMEQAPVERSRLHKLMGWGENAK